MGYGAVWVMRDMDFEGFDCIQYEIEVLYSNHFGCHRLPYPDLPFYRVKKET